MPPPSEATPQALPKRNPCQQSRHHGRVPARVHNNFKHTKMKHSEGGRTLPHELAPKGMHQKDLRDKSKDLLHVRLDNIQA